MRKITYCLILFVSSQIFAQQEERHFFPTENITVGLGEAAKQKIHRRDELLQKESLTKGEELELEAILKEYDETKEHIWDIDGSGCSWYCGGGNYKIFASSNLKSENKNTYEAISANDLSYKTAWVEGKKDAGIGEYLEYYFKNESPRVSSIIVANGYLKSDASWENNNRVKSLKFYVNGAFFGILNLTDTKSDQRFELGTFGRNQDGSDLVFKFEINEVYQGKKYNDTAISEIYFDGIDVH